MKPGFSLTILGVLAILGANYVHRLPWLGESIAPFVSPVLWVGGIFALLGGIWLFFIGRAAESSA